MPNALSWRAPKVKALEIREMAESTGRLQALLTGQADIAIGMGPDELPEIEAAGGHLHKRQPHDVISLSLVVEPGKPAADVRVRQALNYAVDKVSITKVILQGFSRPATQGAVEGLLGYNPDLKPYPYDPAKAKALLKEAGYEKGFTLDAEVIVSSNAGDGPIFKAAMSAPDLEQRAKLTSEVLRFYHDEATAIMLHEIPLLEGVAKRVKNYAPQKGKLNYETIELVD